MAGPQLPPYTEDDPRWLAAVREAEALCLECHPGLRPETARLDEPESENHVGVRFGHAGTGWQITLDGNDCTQFTVEAHAGEGWVIAHIPHVSRPNTVLMHLDHPIVALLPGEVTVTRPGGLLRPT